MTTYYEGKIFRTADGKFYTNDVDGDGFVEIATPELTGDISDALAGANSPSASNVFATMADTGGGGLPYKVYSALLTQTGTNAPVATVLQNTLGGDPVWSREQAGLYHATLTGAFTAGKTFIAIVSMYADATGNQILSASRRSDNICDVYLGAGGDLIDISSADPFASIEIRVYPESGDPAYAPDVTTHDADADAHAAMRAAHALPYKVYTALLTQTGNNAPVATVLQNTLDGVVEWTRSSEGNYTGILAGAFTEGKVVCFAGTHTNSQSLVQISRLDSDRVLVVSFSLSEGYSTDGLLIGDSVEIRVYP